MQFDPFADEAAVRGIGNLTVENRLDRLSIHGSLDVTRDREGLARARDLRDLLLAAIARLEAEDLPDRVRTGKHTDRTPNPFR